MIGKPSKKELKYWNDILEEHGLSMESGRSSKLSYVGDSAILDRVQGQRAMDYGRNEPKERV